MKYLVLFRSFLQKARDRNIKFARLDDLVTGLLRDREELPVCDLANGTVDGRSGFLAVQKCN
jgi:hypothetical protein